MNKTVSITIGGALFTIEEDAYQQLEQYLTAIKAHFSQYDDATEVVEDIESRIAEQFSQWLSPQKKTIAKEDMVKLISIMGTVHDITESATLDEEVYETSQPSKTVRKIYRDPENAILGGVCAGLGAYMGIDPVIVRVIFVASLFFGGIGVPAYLILWLIVPEATTTSQRMEMSGQPVTLANLEETIKDKLNVDMAEVKKKTNNAFVKAMELPFSLLKHLVNFIKNYCIPFVRKFIGVIIAVVGSLMFAASTIAAFVLIVMKDSPNIDFPLRETLLTHELLLIIAIVYVAIAIPFLFIAMLGNALTRWSRIARPSTGIALFGIWMVAVVAGGAYSIDVAPRVRTFVEQETQKTTITKEYELEDFSAINIRGNHNVVITQSTTTSVEIIGREKDIERLSVASHQDKLSIAQTQQSERLCLWCITRPTTITIKTPNVHALDFGHSVDAEVYNVETETLMLTTRSSSEVVIEAIVTELTILASSSSDVTIHGEGSMLYLTGSSSADMYLEDFPVEHAVVTLSSSADAELNISETLQADLSSSSELVANKTTFKEAQVTMSSSSEASLAVSEKITGSLSSSSELRYTGDAIANVQTSSSAEVYRNALLLEETLLKELKDLSEEIENAERNLE